MKGGESGWKEYSKERREGRDRMRERDRGGWEQNAVKEEELDDG